MRRHGIEVFYQNALGKCYAQNAMNYYIKSWFAVSAIRKWHNATETLYV